MEFELSYDRDRDLIGGRVEGDIDLVMVEVMAAKLTELVASSGSNYADAGEGE